MTKEETIKVLQSIEDRAVEFPNMTECDWVAIAAAKRHLQEEPVSEDLEEEIDNYVKRNGYDGLDSIEEVKYIANHFAKWQKEQMTTKAIDGKVIANGMGNPILHLWDKGRHLIGKKVKVIVIEEE